MAKAKRLPPQVLKVKNYGDDWINRLAAVLAITAKMEPKERAAALAFIKSAFREEWPPDSY